MKDKIGIDGAKFYREDANHALVQNMPRLGDIDLDGYPDLVFNVAFKENGVDVQKAVILQNSDCDSYFLEKNNLKEVGADLCRNFGITPQTK